MKNYPLYKGRLAQQNREKFLIIPQVGNAETDETGFGGFVTMPLGIFTEYFAPSRRRFISPSQTTRASPLQSNHSISYSDRVPSANAINPPVSQ
jgi:hypothetical protein